MKTIFAATFGIAAIFLIASPNFDSTITTRLSPLGSDFLQEWTGGYIWRSDSRSKLYATDHFKSVQHDPKIVGFTWPESKFYPMVYPPFYYLVFSPLSTIPYSAASKIWLIALAGLAGLTVWSWTVFYEPARQHWGKCLLATLAFFPFLMSLNTAHKSILLLLILSSSFLLLRHKKPILAGIVFGLIAFKPHLGLLIGGAMLLKKQWNFVAGCLTSVLVLIGLSMIAGMDLCQDYFAQCLTMGGYAANEGYQLTIAQNLSGAIGLTFGSDSAVGNILFWSSLIAVLVGLAFALRGSLDAGSPQFAIQFSVLIVATILLSPHFYIYDLVIVLLPIALIVFEVIKNDHLSLSKYERTTLKFLCVGMFLIAGLSEQIAATIFIQPNMIFLAAIFWYLIWLGSNLVIAGSSDLNPTRPATNQF